MKQQLLQLTIQKEYNLIKDLLINLPKQDKGKIFEQYLAELYAGNGYLVKVQGGRGDLGADILLYHPKTPNQVSFIIQAKNHAKPLTFDQTRIELVKFEEKAITKYNCQQNQVLQSFLSNEMWLTGRVYYNHLSSGNIALSQ